MNLQERNEKLDEAKALVAKGWVPCAGDCRTTFCALNALSVVGLSAVHVRPIVLKLTGDTGVANYNDHASKEEVLALFDLAKELPL